MSKKYSNDSRTRWNTCSDRNPEGAETSDPPDGDETAWFRRRLLDWYDRYGRKDLPWQQQATPYHVWVSEIMLQQTQVATVIPYYQRFMARFPDPATLAAASQEEVLRYWAGLGYYARARNLHRAAQLVCERHGGCVPLNLDALQALPGIGRSTAGAILALAGGQRAAILDGNVKRVLCRYRAVAGWPGLAAVNHQLWALAEHLTPQRRCAAYTQAIMDLGALVCTRGRPDCQACPLAPRCRARAAGSVSHYPAPKPRRILPVRRTTLLILENERREILLEKRPPTGIWGGLWSLPECPHEDRRQVRKWCRTQLDCHIEIHDRLPALRHSFTHFHLDIQPLHARVTGCGTRVMEAGRHVWYNVAQLQRQALAAPVRRLLQGLFTFADS